MSCNCSGGTCSSNENAKTVTYEVQQEDVYIAEELERAYYEYNGLLQLLTQFTSTSPYKPDDERYNAILNEYLNRFITYNLLFEQILKMAVEDLNINRIHIINTSFSFIEKTLYVELKEDDKLCQE